MIRIVEQREEIGQLGKSKLRIGRQLEGRFIRFPVAEEASLLVKDDPVHLKDVPLSENMSTTFCACAHLAQIRRHDSKVAQVFRWVVVDHRLHILHF